VVQWHNGITPTGCAKAQDYGDGGYHLTIKACHKHEVHIGSKYSWPELDQQIAWVQEAWKKHVRL
jgi:hypothetical protein